MAGRLTLAEQAIDCFGPENQTRKAAEECLELAASLLKLADKANGYSDENIGKTIEEIADVKICIEQLEKIYCLEAINKAKNQKEIRLFDTICRTRSERNRESNGNISSASITGLQRGNSIKQSGAGTVKSICKGEGGDSVAHCCSSSSYWSTSG